MRCRSQQSDAKTNTHDAEQKYHIHISYEYTAVDSVFSLYRESY